MSLVKNEMGIRLDNQSRTEHSAQNTTVAMVSRVLAILMGYAVRVVFTHTLSENYVGVNGLFTDIISVLSLTEMGLETAITYALYKPIAQADVEKQKSIMQLYRTFYRVVAGVVLCAGLLVIPFLDVLIKNKPDIPNLTYIYLLYLLRSVLSYLLIYKKTLMDAHQLSYIGTGIKTMSWVVQDILQIAVLLLTHDFLLYLYIYIGATVAANLVISRKAEKLYPFLKDKAVTPLQKEERTGIFRNVRAMMMHKVGKVVVNNTDNLVLSAIVGIVSVGKYSNYYLVIESVQQVLTELFTGVTASVGNLGVTSDTKRTREVYGALFFATQWMYCVAAITLFELLPPFVMLSFGEQFLFDRTVTAILCFNFFITGMGKATLMFRDSLGLFWYDRYKAVVQAVLNLVISIILAKWVGAAGVFLGTLFSMLLTASWVEPYVLYKYHFHTSVVPYLLRFTGYTLQSILIWLLVHWLCSFAGGGMFVQMILKGLLCVIVPSVIIAVFYCRSREWKYITDKFVWLWNRRMGNHE